MYALYATLLQFFRSKDSGIVLWWRWNEGEVSDLVDVTVMTTWTSILLFIFIAQPTCPLNELSQLLLHTRVIQNADAVTLEERTLEDIRLRARAFKMGRDR